MAETLKKGSDPCRQKRYTAWKRERFSFLRRGQTPFQQSGKVHNASSMDGSSGFGAGLAGWWNSRGRMVPIPRAERHRRVGGKAARLDLGCEKGRSLEGRGPRLRLVVTRRLGRQGFRNHGGFRQTDQAQTGKLWLRRHGRRLPAGRPGWRSG